MPELQSYIGIPGAGRPRRAWTANLAVSGKAERVYGDLRAQAQRAGFGNVASVAQAFHTSADPGAFGGGSDSGAHLVTCSGRGGAPDLDPNHQERSVQIEVVRCASCRPATGIGRVLYDAGSGTGDTGSVKHLVASQRIDQLTLDEGATPRPILYVAHCRATWWRDSSVGWPDQPRLGVDSPLISTRLQTLERRTIAARCSARDCSVLVAAKYSSSCSIFPRRPVLFDRAVGKSMR